jgi:hypothetical protein
MASTYVQDELVLAYHGPMIYQAKVSHPTCAHVQHAATPLHADLGQHGSTQ